MVVMACFYFCIFFSALQLISLSHAQQFSLLGSHCPESVSVWQIILWNIISCRNMTGAEAQDLPCISTGQNSFPYVTPQRNCSYHGTLFSSLFLNNSWVIAHFHSSDLVRLQRIGCCRDVVNSKFIPDIQVYTTVPSHF